MFKKFRFRNRVDTRLGQDEFHTPEHSLEDVTSDLEDLATFRKNKDANRQRGKWFGRTVFSVLVILAGASKDGPKDYVGRVHACTIFNNLSLLA